MNGQKKKDDTCDTHKGNVRIIVDPRDSRTLSEINTEVSQEKSIRKMKIYRKI